MGREVRRVPPNWQHPSDENGPIPMLDQNYDDELSNWLDDFDRVRRGELDDEEGKSYSTLADWLVDYPPPKKGWFRPWRDEEATWYQVWETVSEGTPVTPPFATREELIDYLVEGGDDWDRKRGTPPPSRDGATAFVNAGWAPTFVLVTRS